MHYIAIFSMIFLSCTNHVSKDKDRQKEEKIANLEISRLDEYLKNNTCGPEAAKIFENENPTFNSIGQLPIKQFCQPANTVGNRKVVLITADGVRSNEAFLGADNSIAKNSLLTIQNGTQQLFPFLKSSQFQWRGNHFLFDKARSKIAAKLEAIKFLSGQPISLEVFQNCLISNAVGLSLPGYSDLLSGIRQFNVESNSPPKSLDFIPTKHLPYPTLADRLLTSGVLKSEEIAMFSSWSSIQSVFSQNNQVPFHNNTIVSIHDLVVGTDFWENQKAVPEILKPLLADDIAFFSSGISRFDRLTHQKIMEYLNQTIHKPSPSVSESEIQTVPRFLFFSYGDPDENGHRGDYLGYLNAIKSFDAYVNEIVSTLEASEYYKGQTSYIITTDHGRGEENMWSQHTTLKIKNTTPFAGSQFIWTAIKPDTLNGTAAILESWNSSSCNHFQITRLILALLGGRY